MPQQPLTVDTLSFCLSRRESCSLVQSVLVDVARSPTNQFWCHESFFDSSLPADLASLTISICDGSSSLPDRRGFHPINLIVPPESTTSSVPSSIESWIISLRLCRHKIDNFNHLRPSWLQQSVQNCLLLQQLCCNITSQRADRTSSYCCRHSKFSDQCPKGE